MHRQRAGVRALVVVAAGVAVAGVLAAPAAAASGRTQVQIQDRCDPATFPAEAGCIGTRLGLVTFEEFLDELNPDDGGHGAWRNSRAETHLDHGDTLHVRNTGGEAHTFTEVANFGRGIVPDLNAALPDGTPDAVPLEDPFATVVPPGASRQIRGLSPGEHLYECLIHPWMRTTVEVRHH